MRLKRLWKHDDPAVVSLAITIASRLQTRPKLEDYARLMKNADPDVRIAVLQGMAQTGEKKVVRLVNAAMADAPAPALRKSRRCILYPSVFTASGR